MQTKPKPFTIAELAKLSREPWVKRDRLVQRLLATLREILREKMEWEDRAGDQLPEIEQSTEHPRGVLLVYHDGYCELRMLGKAQVKTVRPRADWSDEQVEQAIERAYDDGWKLLYPRALKACEHPDTRTIEQCVIQEFFRELNRYEAEQRREAARNEINRLGEEPETVGGVCAGERPLHGLRDSLGASHDSPAEIPLGDSPPGEVRPQRRTNEPPKAL